MRIIAEPVLNLFSSHLQSVNNNQTKVLSFYFLTYSNGKLKVNEVGKTGPLLGSTRASGIMGRQI